MKTYSIGRDINCEIVIDDNTDVISRRHALLNVTSSGKMTIIDQSNNGTYVNGIRISSNVPVPVTRRDTISFAHVAKLDWNLVSKKNQLIKHSIIGASTITVLIILAFGIKYIGYASKVDNSDFSAEILQDSTNNSKSIAKQDSIKKAAVRNDSIRKAKSNNKKIDKPKKMNPVKTKKQEQKIENKRPTRVAG